MIRVLVSATHPVVRAGLEAMLREDARFTLVRSPGEPADVTVADGEAPAENGAPVVLLSDDRASAWRDSVASGVRAVLRRDVTGAELAAAVEAVAAGLAVLHPEDTAALAHAPAIPASGEEDLTPREIEVLRMMAEGLGNKTIAWRLGISEHTVKFHVASILSRLRASGRTEAVMLGVRRGLVLL